MNQQVRDGAELDERRPFLYRGIRTPDPVPPSSNAVNFAEYFPPPPDPAYGKILDSESEPRSLELQLQRR